MEIVLLEPLSFLSALSLFGRQQVMGCKRRVVRIEHVLRTTLNLLPSSLFIVP